MALSRRELLVGAGAAAATPGASSAVAAAAPRRVGVAPEARQAIGVIGTILQDGPQLTGFGWITQVAGLSPAELFTDPRARGAQTARLRWHAEVRVDAIDVLPALFLGTGRGQLRIFFARDGGAQPDRPETFRTGRLVARYRGEFRNVQTVIAPDHAVTEIVGELVQRSAHPFAVRGHRRLLGRAGSLQHLVASGPATRTEPTIPRSTRFVAGGISIPR